MPQMNRQLESTGQTAALDVPVSAYEQDYYLKRFGPVPYERNPHWLNLFRVIAEEIIRSLRPESVFDAGCAHGFLVESLFDRGVEAKGCDVSEYAISQVRPDLRGRCWVASLSETVPEGRYDLVTCIEVLEHIPQEEMSAALDNICSIGERVLFSSTPSDFDEPTHVNVQPVIHWLREFDTRGFTPDLAYNASFVAPHAFLVRRSGVGTDPAALRLMAETLGLRRQEVLFLARHNQIEHLEKQVALLDGEIATAHNELRGERDAGRGKSSELESLRRSLSGAEVSLDASRQAVADEQQARDRLKREAAALLVEIEDLKSSRSADSAEVARLRSSLGQYEKALTGHERDLAAAQAQLVEHRTRLAQAADEANRTRTAMEPWIESAQQHAAALAWVTREAARVEAELDHLRSSPGWRAVMRYRQWLNHTRGRSPWFRRHVDPFLARALRRLGMAGSFGQNKNTFLMPQVSVQPPQSATRPLPPAPVPAGEPAPPPLPPRMAQARNLTYEEWIEQNEPTEAELEVQRRVAACISVRPLVSILCPVYRTPLKVLREMVVSVQTQTYDKWELCIAAARDEDDTNLEYLRALCERDSRVKLKLLERNEGISGNSNVALEIASGEFLALLDHDDTLAPFALFEVVQALNQDRELRFIYSDKDQLTSDGSRRVDPLFKPQWSPEVMWNANYLTHFCVMRTEDVRAIGGWRKETDGAQDWDLFNRVVRLGGKVRHIPRVLYHWRQIGTSVAVGGLDAKPYASQGQIRAVSDHLTAIGLRAGVTRGASGDLRIQWEPNVDEKVSVLMIGGVSAGNLIRAEELARTTDHPNFEILFPCDASGSTDGVVRPIRLAKGGTFEGQVSAMAEAALGEILVLLHAAASPSDPSWLTELTGPLQHPEIGVVGGRVLDPDTHVIRHCGLVILSDGRTEAIYAGLPSHVNEVFGSAGWYRNWTAVGGAGIALRKETWRSIRGLTGAPVHPRADVHLCLKVTGGCGLRVLYNPYATFVMRGAGVLEQPLAGWGETSLSALRARFADGDPYFHPQLVLEVGGVGFRRTERATGPDPGTDYTAESRALIQWFDATTECIEATRQARSADASRLRSITWMLPQLANPFYGGAHTILRFADAFRRMDGVESRFCFLGSVDTVRMRRMLGSAFPALASSEVLHVSDLDLVRELPETDAAVCTLWTTAYALLRFQQARRRFYLMQDDEALFYPAGSTSALVEATYGFGFKAICNTVSLLNRYRGTGGEGTHFEPCIDPAVFHPNGRGERGDAQPLMLFAYARPHHPRNCFELLAEALRKVKSRMGDEVLIVTAGETWDPADYGLENVLINLGLLDYRTTGALYRACDAGTSLMMTRHPSYLPLEHMACGSLVITNRNKDTEWLLKDGVNCCLAEPTPSSLAARIEEGLRDSKVRREITQRAQLEIQGRFADWDKAAAKVLDYIRKGCEGR